MKIRPDLSKEVKRIKDEIEKAKTEGDQRKVMVLLKKQYQLWTGKDK